MSPASNISHDIVDIKDDDPVLRPSTPSPGANRTLRRTISSASIETIRPRDKNKGIRQRIEEIVKKRDAKKNTSSQDVSRSTGGGRPRIRSSRSTKEWKRRERPAPLQTLSIKPEDDVELPPLPAERDTKSTVLDCQSDTEEEPWEDRIPIVTVLWDSGVSRAGIKDLKLNIKSLESDVTIWDGLHAPYHLYKTRVFLQCTQPHESMLIPDIRLLEMECSTHPIVGSRYAHQPVLQSTYHGANPEWHTGANGVPKVNPADGIHVDCGWLRALEEDGSWGWYRNAYIPLSPRLFDKMDYREFKLVGRAWIEDECVEGELTFGMSMLLRGLDME